MTDFQELVYRGVESDVLDYKAPVNWNLYRAAKLSGSPRFTAVRRSRFSSVYSKKASMLSSELPDG